MSTADVLDHIDEHLAAIAGFVRKIREEQPDEVALLDSQIEALQARRDAIGAWHAIDLADWSLLREVARTAGTDGSWDWSKDDTLANSPSSIPVVTMAATFGPDWQHVVRLVRTAGALSADEIERYRIAVGKVYEESPSAWSNAWRAVDARSGPAGAALRALRAFGVYVDGASVGAALARRSDLLAGNDIDRGYYERLTRAWREEIGPVHPEDDAL